MRGNGGRVFWLHGSLPRERCAVVDMKGVEARGR